jgi:uncharacterized protein (DUF305 family)
MKRNNGHKWLATFAALSALGIANGALAQRNDNDLNRDAPTTKEHSQNPAAAGRDPGAVVMDQMAAEGIMQMSQAEIQLANFALQHTKNEEVRSFAQTLIKDHLSLNKQLERFISDDVRARWASESPPARAGEAGEPQSRAKAPKPSAETAGQPVTSGTKSESGAKPASLFQIHQDISDQLVASIERELGQYQGNDFDRAFLGQQYWAHVVFIASATAGGKHLSGSDLKLVADQGAKTAGKHLEDCRKLIGNLSANVARGTETTPRR